MPVRQVDPGMLEGEALQRWYRRSPAEIERMRRQAEDSDYDAFFNRLRPADAAQDAHDPMDRSADQSSSYLLSTSAPKSLWDYWPKPSCQNCHGHGMPVPPLFPPNSGEGSRGPTGPRGGQSDQARPQRGQLKQCDIQYEEDSRICRRVGTERCWKSAADRQAYCVSSKG